MPHVNFNERKEKRGEKKYHRRQSALSFLPHPSQQEEDATTIPMTLKKGILDRQGTL